jgi:hypothetical protein
MGASADLRRDLYRPTARDLVPDQGARVRDDGSKAGSGSAHANNLREINISEFIYLKETRFDCSDLSDLQTLLRQLVGQPFRCFRVSYADELRLHLGDLQDYSNPKMRNRTRGSSIVGARASSWVVISARQHQLATSDEIRIDQPDARAAKRVDIKTIETGDFITPGCIVTSARTDRSAHGFSLQLRFSDGSTIVILPTPELDLSVPEG